MSGFIPWDMVSQLEAVAPEDCPYCVAWPDEPCVLHRNPDLADALLAEAEAEAASHLIDELEEERIRGERLP